MRTLLLVAGLAVACGGSPADLDDGLGGFGGEAADLDDGLGGFGGEGPHVSGLSPDDRDGSGGASLSGETNTGGASSSGGDVGSGGVATGGASTGGASTGGDQGVGGSGGTVPEGCEGWHYESLETGECLVVLGFAKLSTVCLASDGNVTPTYCQETVNEGFGSKDRWMIAKPGEELKVYRGTWSNGNCSADALNSCNGRP